MNIDIIDRDIRFGMFTGKSARCLQFIHDNCIEDSPDDAFYIRSAKLMEKLKKRTADDPEISEALAKDIPPGVMGIRFDAPATDVDSPLYDPFHFAQHLHEVFQETDAEVALRMSGKLLSARDFLKPDAFRRFVDGIVKSIMASFLERKPYPTYFSDIASCTRICCAYLYGGKLDASLTGRRLDPFEQVKVEVIKAEMARAYKTSLVDYDKIVELQIELNYLLG